MVKDLSGILTTIGNTPLIELKRISSQYPFNVFAKLEFFNPSGSLKDRTALNIIKSAILNGGVSEKSTIIESSSGNLGLGLAMVCKYLHLPFICVIDPRVTSHHINLLKQYDAHIVTVYDPDIISGEFLPALQQKVMRLLKEIPNAFWPNQHANLNNAKAQHQTMEEIVLQLSEVDYLFCATSSCGTLRGCHHYLVSKGLNVKIYAVDALGSKIFSKQSIKRIIPGHGAGIVPELYHDQIKCTPVIVSPEETVAGCKHLFEKEALLVGGSSGAIISAVEKVKNDIEPGKNCVMIFCDGGERYLDSIYSEEWCSVYLNSVNSGDPILH